MERSEIVQLIDKLTDTSKAEARRISAKLENGKIDVNEWKAAILALLVSAHLIAATVGRGGRSAMTSRDWQKVNDKVSWQAGYLEKFGQKIASGAIVITAGVIAARAVKYFAAPFVSYQEAKRDAAIDRDAKRPDADKADKPIMARLVQNSKEGCDECKADADEGWMPVDDMQPIGSRECGDYCLCDIEFSDDEGRDTTDYEPQIEMR